MSKYLSVYRWNFLCSDSCCFSAQHWLMAPAYQVCLSWDTSISEHLPLNNFWMWMFKFILLHHDFLSFLCRYLPHVNTSSLTISPPELVATRMAKNQLPSPLCIWHGGNSNILPMSGRVQSASHPHHPALTLPAILFLCWERQRDSWKPTAHMDIQMRERTPVSLIIVHVSVSVTSTGGRVPTFHLDGGKPLMIHNSFPLRPMMPLTLSLYLASLPFLDRQSRM